MFLIFMKIHKKNDQKILIIQNFIIFGHIWDFGVIGKVEHEKWRRNFALKSSLKKIIFLSKIKISRILKISEMFKEGPVIFWGRFFEKFLFFHGEVRGKMKKMIHQNSIFHQKC